MDSKTVGKEWDNLATPLHRQRWLGIANDDPLYDPYCFWGLSFKPWADISEPDRQDIIEWLEAKQAADKLEGRS